MSLRPLDLISHWQIAAPPARVWAALADPLHWPEWWPALGRVPADGAAAPRQGGGLQRLAWAAGGPFKGVITLQTLEALAPERLRLRSGGAPAGAGPAALQGECIWLLRAEAGLTQVTHVWRLDPGSGAARWCQGALAPLLRALHGRVMRAGAAGLAQHLAARPRP